MQRSFGNGLFFLFIGEKKAPLCAALFLIWRGFYPCAPEGWRAFVLAGRAPYADSARFLFAELIYGLFCGNRLSQNGVTGLSPQYNTSLIGRKPPLKWHRTREIPPQQNFSPVAHWGECRGGSAPSALSFPPLSLAKKAVLPPSRRPVRRAQKSPTPRWGVFFIRFVFCFWRSFFLPKYLGVFWVTSCNSPGQLV